MASELEVGSLVATGIETTATGVNGIHLKQQSDNTANSSRVFLDNSTNIWTVYSSVGSFKVASAATIGSTSGTDRLTISSTGLATFAAGIAFSGQTDATGTGITSGATTLNHYEEGTWTPVAKDGSGGTTLTTSLALGTYVRVGKIVYVTSESPATIPHL